VSKYLLLYRGPATPMEDFTPEQSAEQMSAWGEWMGKVGSAMVDGGAPFGERTTVSDDGTSPAPSDQNGYTIVEAGSLDGARALTDGHPSCPKARAGSPSRSSNSCPCSRPGLGNPRGGRDGRPSDGGGTG
jgi:hypothetical protein